MLQKFNKKIKASFALLKDNRGFSLPELIVAVVILAIASGALLHSFVTSSTITTKAMRLNEASDAAQNIQEILKAYSKEDFMNGGSDVVSYLGITESDFSTDAENNTAILRNLLSGNSTFDAKVTFNTGNPGYDSNGEIDLSNSDGFYQINSRRVTNYEAQQGTFQQSILANPDSISDANFIQFGKAYIKLTKKTRKIEIEVKSNEVDENGNVKSVTISGNYIYLFDYTVNADKTGISVIERPASQPYETRIPVHVQNANGGTNIELNKDGSVTTVYFNYWPSYADETIREKSSTYTDTISIYNLEDLPIRIILIKQKPQIKKSDGTYEPMNDVDLSLCETNSNVLIEEFHSMEYVEKCLPLSDSDRPRMVLTNAFLNISSSAGKIGGAKSYKIKGNYSSGFSGYELNAEKTIDGGKLVYSEKKDRLYDVRIEIYESGELDKESPRLFASFNGNKVV